MINERTHRHRVGTATATLVDPRLRRLDQCFSHRKNDVVCNQINGNNINNARALAGEEGYFFPSVSKEDGNRQFYTFNPARRWLFQSAFNYRLAYNGKGPTLQCFH